MSRHYSDPSRSDEKFALPDVEVFYITASDFINADESSWMYERMTDDRDVDADSLAGWYWWSCFPGCLPDSDPFGPFETEEDAIAAAQEND